MEKNELTWQDIKAIIDIYEDYTYEMDQNYREWAMDEDQMGIPNPFTESREDTCKRVLYEFKKQLKLREHQ